MIDNNYIKDFLHKLGFFGDLFLFNKEYKIHNYTIKIDLQQGRIFYRNDEKTVVERVKDEQIQIGDKTTSQFLQLENLVVLEVVDRLLTKGYAPNDIHLERRYPSGRGASGGKSDVCVYGKDEKCFMIIECKTWGAEFENERKKMEEHGGQLFAYLANDQNTKFLVLYASKSNEEGKFDYENLIVPIKDRNDDLKKSLEDIKEENIKLYRDANNKAELYEVWKKEFSHYFHFNGIFDDDANAYFPELKALKKKNLKPLDDSQGLFNKFAEILRHNNISDNANAFNKILSLFLCKIVDEEKNEEDILDFQVKGDEKYEHLIDRLQLLYRDGMKKLNEERVYYLEDEFLKILKLYPQQTPIEQLGEIFRELKYYTNNEFAFKEVYNKKLFIQNGRVLAEVVKLIQNYRFRYNSQQQVLGDFFELMLNHGVKQSEGQFFTPIPIVRYIILSLGFEKIIQQKLESNEDEFILPKILDYACGSGHFLTESMEELQNIVKKIDISKINVKQSEQIENYKKGTHWAKDFIFGIEKDYRLARTSQIACYINGDGDANIIFGDGLENHNGLKTDMKKFDVVIANPPYSVSSFKNYLHVSKTNFELFELLTEKSSQIEALFIERTKQILEDNGLAGIILPSTILSNTGIYTKAREILLKHFEIKAITELGSKTFIATGTTTVILFLKRRNDDFLKDREYIARDFYNHIPRPEHLCYIDGYRFLKMFTNHRDLDYDEYHNFLEFRSSDSNYDISKKLAETEIFKEYKTAFDNSTDIVKFKKTSPFKNYTEEEQRQELAKRFYNYCKDIEKEKFLYFMLCLGDGQKEKERIEEYYQPQQTIVVKIGNDKDTQKEFLGYEFQGRKGQEGIKIHNYGGKLFDTKNYLNPQKASFYIRQHIENKIIPKRSPEQEECTKVYRLFDLIDFEMVEFEKIIKLHSEKKHNITTKWNLLKLSELIEFKGKGKRPASFENDAGIYPFIISSNQHKRCNHADYNMEALLFGDGGNANIHYMNGEFSASDHVIIFVNKNSKLILQYIYYFFSNNLNLIEQGFTGIAIKNLSKDYVSNLKIPLPPKEIQEKIISEIEQVEQKESRGLDKIKVLEQEIEEVVKNINGEKYQLKKIAEIQKGTSITKDKTTLGIIPVIAGGQQAAYYHNVSNREKDIITVSASGAYAGFINYWNEPIFASDCTTIKSTNENYVITKLLFYILKSRQEFFYSLQKGQAQPHVYSKDFENLEIPLPSIEDQKKLLKEIDSKEDDINKIKSGLTNIQIEKEEVLRKYL